MSELILIEFPDDTIALRVWDLQPYNYDTQSGYISPGDKRHGAGNCRIGTLPQHMLCIRLGVDLGQGERMRERCLPKKPGREFRNADIPLDRVGDIFFSFDAQVNDLQKSHSSRLG